MKSTLSPNIQQLGGPLCLLSLTAVCERKDRTGHLEEENPLFADLMATASQGILVLGS